MQRKVKIGDSSERAIELNPQASTIHHEATSINHLSTLQLAEFTHLRRSASPSPSCQLLGRGLCPAPKIYSKLHRSARS